MFPAHVRRTSTEIASDQARLSLPSVTDPNQRAAVEKQIAEWDAAAARYKSEPDAADGQGEGAAELSRRATESEHARDLSSRSTTTTSSRRPPSRAASCSPRLWF